MSVRKQWSRKVTQVVLRDLEAWVQQLYEGFRVRCEVTVSLPVPGDGVRHGVTLHAYTVDGRGRRSELHSDWDVIDDTVAGAVESAAIKMVSKLLLSLENDREREERSEQLPLWRA